MAVAIMLPLRDNNAKVSASVTLFSDELTWNEANQYCRSIGQNLVKIGRQAKEHYLHEHLVSLNISPSKVDIWIGLHAPDPNQRTHLVWTNNCSIPLLYSNWEPGLKSGPNDLCAYIELEYESMYWFLDECEKTKRSFLCESKDGICNSGYFYDTESDTSVATGIGGLTTMSSVTVQQCKNACNPSPMCWGFVFIPSVPKCALFDLNDDPLFIENNQVHAQYHGLYMKRCHFEVDENTNVLSVPSYDSSGSDAVSECMTTTNKITTTRQKTTIDQTTAETMIPSTNANHVTSSNYHVTTRQQTTIDQATSETMIPLKNANHVASSNYHVTTRQQTTIYQRTADAMILTRNANHVTSSNYHMTTRQQTTIDQATADAMIPTTNANHVTSSNYHVTTSNPETTSTEQNLINPTTIQKVSTYSKGKSNLNQLNQINTINIRSLIKLLSD
ncbi:Hypothetical predicted protein [Mytilus galloprovincialis]|uniref:C-type lectin domain-containing protein n=1 Tax=Mytilus galloprovincialis TaxID=29158 RepID=A0A8B6BQV1_MYTGA|nr:Hypothetical predicted protein [Mytilus galloprovincialis]